MNLTIKLNVTIKQAMKKITEEGEKCLVIIDKNKKLVGTLSDGDLRKAILSGHTIEDPIIDIYQKKPKSLLKDDYNEEEVKNLFVNKKFDLIPVVDSEGYLVDIILFKRIFKKNQAQARLNIPVVIMSGGLGKRMEPFTKVLPKPLIPINDKPVLDHIIEKFLNFGCTEFYLTVNYKSRVIKAYFDEGEKNYKINFVDEEKPLGTAGSIKLLKDTLKGPFFVTNCDIIINTDYKQLFEYHLKNNYDLTLVASTKKYVIPYGICELSEKGDFKKINEKPYYNFLINSGLYILNPDLIDLIPHNQFFHITDLIKSLKENGKTVGVFPIDDDSWIDIGQWSEYHRAVDQL